MNYTQTSTHNLSPEERSKVTCSFSDGEKVVYCEVNV